MKRRYILDPSCYALYYTSCFATFCGFLFFPSTAGISRFPDFPTVSEGNTDGNAC